MSTPWTQPCLTDSSYLGVFLTMLRLLGIGWAWSGVFNLGGREKPDAPALAVVTRWVPLGFLLNALLGILLASLGLFSVLGQWLGVALLVVTGVIWSRQRGDQPVRPDRKSLLLAFMLVTGFAMAVPSFISGWVAGGRDPGLYFGEAIRLARTGTFFPGPAGDFVVPAGDLLLRERFGFTEILPVLPFDAATQSERPFFFPLTSVLMGQMALDGGLRAARCFAGLFGGLFLLALLAAPPVAGRRDRVWLLLAIPAFAVMPVVRYHLTLPMTEFLELLCVAGAALCLDRFTRSTHLAFAGFLFLGVANRFSFSFFGALLLVLHLWTARHDLPRGARLQRWLAGVAGIGLGALLCLWTSRAGLQRLDEQAQELAVMCAGLLAAGLVHCWMPARWFPERWHAGTLVLPGLLVLVVAGALKPNGLARMRFAFDGALAFIGPGLLLAGLIGLAWWLWREGREHPAFTTLLVYFALIGALILTRFEIAPDFPWASRRFLLGLAPAAALGVGCLCWLLWQHRPAGGAALAALAFLLPFSTLRSALPIHHRVDPEFRGLPQVLAEVDAKLRPQDVVICDHFVWGTPLRMLFGRQVLDGDWLREKNRVAEGLTMVRAALPKDGRLLVFTSVASGAEWVDWCEAKATRLGEWPLAYSQMKAHRNQRKLEPENKARVFRLYDVTTPGSAP